MIPGCGWTPGPWHAPERPTRSNNIPCAARSGYRPAHATFDDTWTIGHVGLCRSCLKHPADLLQQLSATISDE